MKKVVLLAGMTLAGLFGFGTRQASACHGTTACYYYTACYTSCSFVDDSKYHVKKWNAFKSAWVEETTFPRTKEGEMEAAIAVAKLQVQGFIASYSAGYYDCTTVTYPCYYTVACR